MIGSLPAAARAALRFEEKILPNGLALRVLPMPEYGSVHAIYATGFGAIHRSFQQGGKRVDLPAGVAHFLEHKMFEGEDGVDAFTLYAATGASPNAYTGFERTSYIFTATGQIPRNLDILLNTVGKPYFTAATVEKEQGIIAQEIKMYEDEAEMRCFYAVMECLYHNYPIREDIAGTVESISHITPEMLYACTNAYYNPAGMVLAAAGSITMEELEAAVARAGLPAAPPAPTTTLFPAEPAGVASPGKEFKMSVAMPLFGIGFKEPPPEGDTTKREVVSDVLTELLCGETSALYRRLYDEGLVQPGFGAEYGCVQGAFHFLFSGESEQPEKVREEILKEIRRQRSEGVDQAQFDTCKKMMYGEAIADLENVERVASALSASYFRHRTPEKEMEAIAALTVDDVNELLQTALQEENSATVVVRPSE